MGEQHNFWSKIHLEPKMVKIDSIMVCSPAQALIIQPSPPGFVSNNICTSGDLPFFDSAVFHSKRRCSALCDEEIRVLLWNCSIRKDWNSLFIWEFSQWEQVSFELISFLFLTLSSLTLTSSYFLLGARELIRIFMFFFPRFNNFTNRACLQENVRRFKIWTVVDIVSVQNMIFWWAIIQSYGQLS